MKQISFIFSIVILLMGCSNDDSNQSKVDYSLIVENTLNGKGTENISKSNLVINNAESWNSLLVKLNLLYNAMITYPDINVDFSKYQVIAIFDEIRPDAGYSINVKDITETQNTTIIKIAYIKATSAFFTTTQPYCIIKIPKSNNKIIFE
jgi:uncharacterized protein YcfL